MNPHAVETKQCRKCELPKLIDAFGKCSANSDGRQSYCKKCQVEYNNQRLTNHPEIRSEYNRNNYQIHRSARILKAVKNQKAYISKNRDKVRSARRLKYATNPNSRLSANARRRIILALQGKTKSSRTHLLLGCSISELRSHIESKFKIGMTWNNYGSWHIDHIRPCSSFNLVDAAEQRQCFHFTNLQPLWAKENLSKGGRQ